MRKRWSKNLVLMHFSLGAVIIFAMKAQSSINERRVICEHTLFLLLTDTIACSGRRERRDWSR